MQTKVLPCECTGAGIIRVKSGSANQETKLRVEVPFMNRENGARFHDKKYGKGMRLHNVKGKTDNGTVRCTVCGRIK